MARIFAGYAAVFFDERDPGTQYKLARDTYERISPNAFDKVLAGDEDVVGAYNHNPDFLLGRRSNGTMRCGSRYEYRFTSPAPTCAGPATVAATATNTALAHACRRMFPSHADRATASAPGSRGR